MTKELVFEESISSNIFDTTVESVAINQSSTPLHASLDTETIDLSTISWSEANLTRNQKNNLRKRARDLRKNKNVSIKKVLFKSNLLFIKTFFYL